MVPRPPLHRLFSDMGSKSLKHTSAQFILAIFACEHFMIIERPELASFSPKIGHFSFTNIRCNFLAKNKGCLPKLRFFFWLLDKTIELYDLYLCNFIWGSYTYYVIRFILEISMINYPRVPRSTLYQFRYLDHRSYLNNTNITVITKIK